MKYLSILLLITISFSCSQEQENEISSKKAYYEFSFRKLESAIMQYYVDCGEYPSSLFMLKSEQECEKWQERDLSFDLDDIWGNEYLYIFPSTKPSVDFELTSVGEDGEEGTVDDISNLIDEKIWRGYYNRQ